MIDADGDGLDSTGASPSPGALSWSAARLTAEAGALDYDGSCTVTGGVLIAAGSAGMAQAPGSSSTPGGSDDHLYSTQPAGTLIRLTDAKGGPYGGLFPGEGLPVGDYLHPTLSQGGTLYPIQRRHLQRRRHRGYAASGTLSGSAELSTITLSGVVTSVRSDGSAAGGAGGGMAPGGRRLRRPSRTVKKKRSPRRL